MNLEIYKKGLLVLFVCSVVFSAAVYVVFRPSVNERWHSYAVSSDSLAAVWKSRIQPISDTLKIYKKRHFRPLSIELNAADSTQLTRVYGIGPVLSARIVNYRKRLGGFVNIDQLNEVKGINEQNFTLVKQNFTLDTSLISKININFATQKSLEAHPYITPNMARRLLKGRKLKGGYSNNRQLTETDILTPKEAKKIAPYLSFTNQ